MSTPAVRPRWKVLLPLLLATVGLVAWFEWSAGTEEADVASAVVRPRQAPQPRAEGAPPRAGAPAEPGGERELRIDRAERKVGEAPGKGDDPFARMDWNPPAPKAPPPAATAQAAPAPRPVPPPIPYAYFGMSIQDGRTVVFVTRQERTLVLAVGEVVENTYRVEEIRATEVVLTYIPLNERQVMMIGTAKP
jgi:hypothetical protein